MSSQYRYIFFYYRGPSPADVDEAMQARQVEDNTTKALINTLELGADDLTSSFLRFVGVEADDEYPDRRGVSEFFLQGGPLGETAPHRRLLIITAGQDAARATWGESSAQKGRIDAAIHIPDQLLVAIEVKVGAILDYGQLRKHAEDWKIPTTEDGIGVAPHWTFTTWADVHRWARRELTECHEPSTRLLLGQLAEYLEIIGVTPFSGFRREDFELLNDRRIEVEAATAQGAKPAPANLTEAHLIKDRVAKLWDAILPILEPAESMALGRIHVGSLRGQDYRIWAQTNAGQEGVNFTFELDPDQLELDLVAWKGDQAELFDRWLDQPKSRERLAALPGFELVVWRRRAIAAQSGKPYWRQNTYRELERIPMPPPDDLDVRLASHRRACETGWELLAYHLRRSWPRDDVLASGDDLASEAASALRAAIPLLHEINWPQRVPLPARSLDVSRARGLRDYGAALAEDGERDPAKWRVMVEGPAVMVTSPSGMHVRGIRYFVGVWPGPAADQAVFVAFTLTKGYASGGREGHITLLYYGPDVRDAVRKVNSDLRMWEQSEFFPAESQPSERRPLDEAEILRGLRDGQTVEGPDWTELDAIARRGYGAGLPAGSWAKAHEPCAMTYVRMVD